MRLCAHCAIGLDKQGNTCANCGGHGCHPDDIAVVEEPELTEEEAITRLVALCKVTPKLTADEAYARLAECWPYCATYGGLGAWPV